MAVLFWQTWDEWLRPVDNVWMGLNPSFQGHELMIRSDFYPVTLRRLNRAAPRRRYPAPGPRYMGALGARHHPGLHAPSTSSCGAELGFHSGDHDFGTLGDLDALGHFFGACALAKGCC